MNVEEKEQGDIAIITIHGNLVGTCEADSLHAEIEKLINAGKLKMVLDLSDVHWIGSLCIGALMREIISIRKKGGDMHLSGLSRKVRRVFQITKLDGIINIFPTIRAATEGFQH
jgi:anti-anti-sigma factor